MSEVNAAAGAATVYEIAAQAMDTMPVMFELVMPGGEVLKVRLNGAVDGVPGVQAVYNYALPLVTALCGAQLCPEGAVTSQETEVVPG